MTTMPKAEPRGYTTVVARKIQQADQAQPAVQLGVLCVAHDIPMADVAEKLGVTRMTVYNWFTNKFSPSKQYLPEIVAIIDALK